MVTKIKNGRLILPSGIKKGLDLYFDDDKIIDITAEERPFNQEIDAAGRYVSPGFIETHVHGGGGYDFTDGGTEPIISGAELHMQHGTTSILPTPSACSQQVLIRFLEDLRAVMSDNSVKPRILGAHLEGPYFSFEQAGAQDPDLIREPNPEEYMPVIEQYGNIILRWSFAPELKGAEEFCKALIANGIFPSIAHSDATWEEVSRVYNLGCKTFTHLYSGMSMITRKKAFRRLGVVESAYLLDDIDAEIIADGCHLPPELLRLIVKLKGTEHLVLVTDALRFTGLEEGADVVDIYGNKLPYIVEDGVVKLSDRSAFAGSIATADRLVRNMVTKVGCSLEDAVRMMTVNPARMLKLDNLGSLCPGYCSDIVLFDDNIEVSRVIVRGRTVHITE